MMYNDVLHKLINVGIQAAREDYGGEGSHYADKLAGSIDGFEECRTLQPEQIRELLEKAGKSAHEAFVRVNEKEISDGEYWRVQARYWEIRWMANCVSVILMNQGMEPITPPTANAVLTVARILGGQ